MTDSDTTKKTTKTKEKRISEKSSKENTENIVKKTKKVASAKKDIKATENQSSQIKDYIEKDNITLTLDKGSTDDINTVYNVVIQYDEFKKWESTQKIDGFRPGMVPLTEENQKKFINVTLTKIMGELDLQNSFAVNYIQEHFTKNEPISLILTIEKMPTIPEVNFSEYSIKSFEAKVTNEDVKKSIEIFSKMNSKPSTLVLDIAAKEGDFIKIEITNLQSANKEIQEIKLGNYMLNVDLEKKLIGQKAGFTTIYSLNEELSFEIKILEVKEAVLMNEEEIANQLKISKDEISKKFKEELEEGANKISQNIINDSILKIIVELQFGIPASILNSEYKETYSKTLFSLKYNKNIHLETFIKGRLNLSLEEFEKKMRNSAIFNAKLKFFLNYYAYKNNIQATEDDINQAMEGHAQYFKDGIKEAKKHFAEDEKARNNLIENIIHPKVLEDIKSKIKIESPEQVTLENLEKININDITYIQLNGNKN